MIVVGEGEATPGIPQIGLRGASRSIGNIYISKAPEINCAIIAVSPPSTLLGTWRSHAPVACSLILLAASRECAIAGAPSARSHLACS